MNVQNIKDIPQVKSKMTCRELNIACAIKWLSESVVAISGGDVLAKWIENNQDKIEDVLCCINRIYIWCKDQQTNKELAQLVIDNKIGDEVKWVKHSDSERWKLLVWWEEG